MFAALGVKVTVVEKRAAPARLLRREIAEGLQYHLRDARRRLPPRRGGDRRRARDADGALTRARERQAASPPTSSSTPPAARGRRRTSSSSGRGPGGRRARPDRGRTRLPDRRRPHLRRGRRRSAGRRSPPRRWSRAGSRPRTRSARTLSMSELLPIGIYTIPEISYVGRTEEELTDAAVPYEVGISRYRELARGQILGDTYGLLKLLVSPEDRHDPRRPRPRHERDRARPHRPDGDGLGGHDRLPRRRGLQLPDAGRVVQGRGARRAQQAHGRRARRPAGQTSTPLP